ncbi:hypothetical protein ECD93_06490, partial [Acinetobacter baumannii]|nr:hypothetical protein [Acinetobacter baumannii]
TEEVILTVPLNQVNHVAGPHGLWKVAIFTKDQFDATYNIKSLSLKKIFMRLHFLINRILMLLVPVMTR